MEDKTRLLRLRQHCYRHSQLDLATERFELVFAEMKESREADVAHLSLCGHGDGLAAAGAEIFIMHVALPGAAQPRKSRRQRLRRYRHGTKQMNQTDLTCTLVSLLLCINMHTSFITCSIPCTSDKFNAYFGRTM